MLHPHPSSGGFKAFQARARSVADDTTLTEEDLELIQRIRDLRGRDGGHKLESFEAQVAETRIVYLKRRKTPSFREGI